MSQIGSKDTQPELIVRRLLTEMGLRYRLHRRDLPGKPDIVFGPRRLVLFVHGCFWHRHRGCRMASTPSANAAFWQTKFDANTARDRRNTTALKRAGWRVAVIWECETRQPERLARRLQRLLPVVSVSA
jgi:DNA mismatch endonuclease (patch repair protein)